MPLYLNIPHVFTSKGFLQFIRVVDQVASTMGMGGI